MNLSNTKVEREFCHCGNLMECKSKVPLVRRTNADLNYSIEIFTIFTCSACHHATLICYSSQGNEDEDERDYFRAYFGGEEFEFDRTYDRLVLFAPPQQLHYAIPQSIAEIIYQAQSILSQSPRASFILCRSVLEEICYDFKIPNEQTNEKGKTFFISLNKRLSQLCQQEQISGELIEIIQGIKELGNEGTHSDHLTFSQQIKIEDASNLLRLVNYVIDCLYVDKYKHQKAAETLSDLKKKILNMED